MVYEGILTIVAAGMQSLISGNPALISSNLDGKKSSATIGYDGPD